MKRLALVVLLFTVIASGQSWHESLQSNTDSTVASAPL